jgi:hypothetical protein
MMIRKKGRRIQLLRAKYIRQVLTEAGDVKLGTGCQRQEMIGTIGAYASEVPDQLREKLSPEEFAQLEEYLAERDRDDRLRDIRWCFESRLVEHLKTARETLEHPPEGQERPLPWAKEQAEAIYAAWDGLRRAMRKAGSPRPVKKKVAAKKKPAGKKKAKKKAPAGSG